MPGAFKKVWKVYGLVRKIYRTYHIFLAGGGSAHPQTPWVYIDHTYKNIDYPRAKQTCMLTLKKSDNNFGERIQLLPQIEKSWRFFKVQGRQKK